MIEQKIGYIKFLGLLKVPVYRQVESRIPRTAAQRLAQSLYLPVHVEHELAQLCDLYPHLPGCSLKGPVKSDKNG